MKCLEKDRTRRYETANGLAPDIQRHLNTEPVIARPSSNLCRVRKLVRRNRLAFTAAAVVAVVRVLGVVGSTRQAIRATQAEREQRCRARAADQARAAEAEQRRRAENAELTVRGSACIADMNLASLYWEEGGSARGSNPAPHQIQQPLLVFHRQGFHRSQRLFEDRVGG